MPGQYRHFSQLLITWTLYSYCFWEHTTLLGSGVRAGSATFYALKCSTSLLSTPFLCFQDGETISNTEVFVYGGVFCLVCVVFFLFCFGFFCGLVGWGFFCLFFLLLFSAFKSMFHCAFFYPNPKITVSKMGKICFSIAWFVIYFVEKPIISQLNKKTILVLPFSSVKLTTNT